jgi:hypothetical protein
MTAVAQHEFVTFSPRVMSEDALANYWMRQATLRLRREVCWCWRLDRTDPLGASLDLTRYWEEKNDFFRSDATAEYLTRLIDEPPPKLQPAHGSFGWLVERLALDDLSAFVLGLALVVNIDGAAGAVIAACLHHPGLTHPTLGLAQTLWDRPEHLLTLADSGHPLWRFGLIQAAPIDWNAALVVPPLVARHLLFPGAPMPDCVRPISEIPYGAGDSIAVQLAAHRIKDPARRLRIVPVHGTEHLGRLSRITGRPILELGDNAQLSAAATLCWMKGADLLVHDSAGLLAIETLPLTIFVDNNAVSQLPRRMLLPVIESESLSYAGRVELWTRGLGVQADTLSPVIDESSRRFRFDRSTINSICHTLLALPRAIEAEDFAVACRAEVTLTAGELAQPVTPRFENEELILPPKQELQFQEVLRAMRSLTEVHYQWGTAKVWNEGGISVLFAGPPGTGKTMAAEVLAIKLRLPMFRIDLSQVVNKYIGETEKNLKRLFDAADISDSILFFDEADSLFGRRTETRDAHDRYANLETSYLLERMERFKGLAILATNRKKDLDEAFLRRLRYLIDFPQPGPEQRRRIWIQSIPRGADASGVEIDFLARGFPLTGGHIRSIVFNACLQSAHRGEGRKLEMEDVMVAIKREYDKMSRSLSLEQFGSFGAVLEGVEGER